MPLRDARTIVPDLVLLPPDPVFYARASDALLDAIEDAEPLVEPGDARHRLRRPRPATPMPHAEAAATERLVRAVRDCAGVAASAGAGEGKFVAWIAATVSAPGEACVVPAGNEREFLAPLSTSFLPVSYDAQRKLALYALRTIGDVAKLDIGPHAGAVRPRGTAALGAGARHRPRRRSSRASAREPVAGSLTMPAPTVNSAALLIAARQLAGRLLQRPAMRYRQVRQLRLRLSLLDGGSWERTLTFREPLGDEEGIVFVLKKLIEPLQLAGPVEEMTLEFIGLTAETGKQRSLLFAEQARRRAQLLAALRQLKDALRRRTAGIARGGGGAVVKDPGTALRTHRLRPLAWPQPLRVETDVARLPAHRRCSKASCARSHAVQDRWRIDDEWWRETPVSRMYYQLQLEGDRVVTVYQDLVRGAWWSAAVLAPPPLPRRAPPPLLLVPARWRLQHR